MPRNVEIKALVKNFDALRAKAAKLARAEGTLIKQADTFFVVPNGRLKLRELEGSEAQLIYYERPDAVGPKLSNYSISPVNNPQSLKHTLGQALGIVGEVKKERWLYLVGNTRIHCDRVQFIGDFMELEVVLDQQQQLEEGDIIAKDLMEKLGVEEKDLVHGAYMDIILSKIKN
ncbi:PREDICTED: uncharacterized protein LOC106808810 [Priapulus caudatus]|uniref:Uncharacterized protein LOC106808810 n=1 Tax=Priapulus caudatus TaxID=37621 RepID=A0ABM1E4N8_PRICU|nr:PREDICTED: uncharacterized protein LOC106808810 [Priapulus caudatus]